MSNDTAAEIREEIGDRIEFIRNEIERGEEVYENPECPHCGREMKFGSTDGGEVRYGCYPPVGEPRDEYDCPYYQEHSVSYAVTKKTRDVNALKRTLRELERVARKIDRVGVDDD